MYASGYGMGAFLMQGGKPTCYYFQLFHGVGLNYFIYDEELYAFVHVVKKLRHYVLCIGKGEHHPHQSSSCNTCMTKVIFSKKNITNGWDLCNKFISLSNIRRL
jgi:hypothetical protein